MRKTFLTEDGKQGIEATEWLDLERITSVEISSEDDLFPIEHALNQVGSMGWRAATPGPQILRLRFDEPQEIRRIQLHIIERAAERMQEFMIYADLTGRGKQEVMRQQFTFSPHGSTEEFEDFGVDLLQVTMLEIRIDPDRSHDPKNSRSYASLASLRLG